MSGRLKRFVKLWVDLFDRHGLLDHASAIAFQVLKSTIPLTLLGVAILGASGEQRIWRKTIAPALEAHLERATFHAIDVGVQKIFSSNSTGLMAFAALLVLWYVSGGVRAVMGAITQIYEVEDDRPWFVRYPLSFGLAGAIVVGLLGALLVLAVGSSLANGGALGVVVGIARWVLAIVLLGVTLGVLVRFAPAEHRAKRWAGAGAAVVIGTWIVASLIFELFVSHVANFKTATGQLTVFLVLIGYVYTSSIILLVGVEIDELLREDATAGERGVLQLLFGIGK